MIDFEWDPVKEKFNFLNHGVSFKEASHVFHDPLGITIYDPDHSEEEERFITIGYSTSGQLLMVSHTDRYDKIRIISVRKLTQTERKEYEEEIRKRNN